MRYLALTALALAMAATNTHAQDAADGPLAVTGSVALVSDYRFRGVSQTDEEMALQGGLTVAHESGAYAGAWASNLAGWGTFGGANIELDLFAGYKVEFGNGLALDAGLLWYVYPGGADDTAFAEPYVKLSGTVGPASMLAGVAYAPKQKALGNFSATPQSRGQRQDNLYIWGDVSGTVPGGPVILKAHLGYSEGNPGLGPNGTSVAPTGEYLDWMIGADLPVGPVTLGVAYIDTDIGRSESAYLLPNFANSNGSSIADSKVVFSLTAAF